MHSLYANCGWKKCPIELHYMEVLQQFIFNLQGGIQTSMKKDKGILNYNGLEMEMVVRGWD